MRPTKATYTDDELRQALEAYDAVLNANLEPYCVVFDYSAGETLPASQRVMLGEFNARNAERTRVYCRGAAFVMKGAVARGVMTAVFWISKPPAETKVFADFDQAMSWASSQLVTPKVSSSRH